MSFMSLLAILYISCLMTLMSLEIANCTPVQRVPKFPNFNYKEVKTSSPQESHWVSAPPTKAKLFRPQEKVASKEDQPTTKLLLSLWAKAIRSNQKNNDTDKDTPIARAATTVGNSNKEMTLTFEKFTMNRQGEWVAFKWGPTPIGIWQDTRFNEADLKRALGGHTKDESHPTNYMRGMKGVHTMLVNERVIWTGLRREIFNKGNYDECHDPVKYTVWRDYMECSLRRNQRIEYYMPRYPLFQKGYNAFYKIYI